MSDYTLPVSYTTVTRVRDAFPSIASASNITSSHIAQYAGMVEAEINAVISKRYALPFTVNCPLLTAIATRETIYRIAVQRALVQFPPAQQGAHPLQIQHRDDQDLLRRIAAGTEPLVDLSGKAMPERTDGAMDVYSTTKGYQPTFNEGAWESMVVDENKLADLEAGT